MIVGRPSRLQALTPHTRAARNKKPGRSRVCSLASLRPDQGLAPVGNGHAACGLRDVFVGTDAAAGAGAAAAFFAAGFFAAFFAAGFFAAFLAAAFFAGAFFAAFLAAAFFAGAFFFAAAFFAGAFFAAAFFAGAFFAAAFFAGAFFAADFFAAGFFAAFLAVAFFAVAITFLLDQVEKEPRGIDEFFDALWLFTARGLPRRGDPVR